MTIKIYHDAFTQEHVRAVEYEGTLAALLEDNGIAYVYKQPQKVSFTVNGKCVDALDWSCVRVSNSDDVQMRIVPHGFFAAALLIGAILVVGMTLLKPKIPNYNRNETPKGEQLAASNAQANTAKLNGTVPEIAGRFIRYPEHLVQPHSYFVNPRTLYQEMFLCIGAGYHDFDPDLVKVGTTPISNLEGAEYFVYQPGDNVSAHGLHFNWYTCPEVGSTNAGGSGLELTAAPSSDLDPVATSYSFGGYTMTATPLPAGWAVGTRMTIRITRPYDVTHELDYGRINGNFVDIAHLSVGDTVTSRIGQTLRIQAKVLDANFDGYMEFDYLNDFDVWLPLKPAVATSVPYWFADPDITLEITSLETGSATYKAIKAGVDFGAWNGFGVITSLPQNVFFDVDGANTIGEWSGPFNACPVSEVTSKVQYDVFFPQGLAKIKDDGGLETISVTIETQWRYVGGAWQSIINTYTNTTMDQIGYTQTINIPTPGAVEVRMRRIGAESTSTQVNDEVQWYGLRALLDSPTVYPNWTTMGVRFKGLGKIGAGSENKINLVPMRKLQTLQSGGTLGPMAATREISAFAVHIAQSVGYELDAWDMDALLSLNSLWKSRGETLDFVFNETTVESALQVTFGAGMSELTIDDGMLKPVREGVRTQYEQVYSAQNTTDGFNRTFTLERVDSNDGVLVEYIDQSDGFTSKTVECKLPGKAGVRLKTQKVNGVVGRDRAWRIGMREARAMEYQKWAYKFTTPMDAMNSGYGSYVALVPDIANYGRSGLILGTYGSTLVLGDHLEFESGKSYVIAWRDDKGSFVGPFPATAGTIDNEVIVSSGGVMPVVRMDRELPHFFFGELSTLTLPALVQKITPAADGKCSVQAVNYDARIYADDDALAPTGA